LTTCLSLASASPTARRRVRRLLQHPATAPESWAGAAAAVPTTNPT
jgi:hypothetical protein